MCAECYERAPEELLAWERRKELGFFRALWSTSWAIMAHPNTVFQRARAEGNLGSAILFALIMQFAAWFTTGLLYIGFFGLVPSAMSEDTREFGYAFAMGTFATSFVWVPLFGLVGTLLMGMVDHLVLRMLGVKGSLETTLRGSCYSLAPLLFSVIPLCSFYVLPLWALVVKVFAYMGLHKTSGWRAAAGALAIPVGLTVLVVGMYAVVLAALIAQES